MPNHAPRGTDLPVRSLQELEPLTRTSNSLALETYGPAFEDVAARPGDLDGLDLLSIPLQGARIPILQNGTNKYRCNSSHPAALLDTFTQRALFTPDCLLIVPEAAHLAAPLMPPEWRPQTALDSVRGQLAETPGGLHIAGLEALRLEQALRFFDSHPGVAFYWQACLRILDEHGWSTDIEALTCGFRRYRCDLGSRFSDDSVESLFVSNRYFRSESGEAGRKMRVFNNPEAPNPSRLLLVGDSHAYSALSHILSHYFRDLTFFWANRVNGYGIWREAVQEAAQDADFIIEETAERFFLHNFCERRLAPAA